MKKIVLLFFLSMFFTGLSAEEMQLYRNDTGSQQFRTLTAEEQYNSIINSFKGIADTRQVGKWVSRMVEQYGREILPYMNKTLMDADFDHEYRDPLNITLEIHYYLFSILVEDELITENEKQLYIIVLKGKLKEYILKYRVLDGTVNMAYRILCKLDESYELPDAEALKSLYEEELGITGIVIGNLELGYCTPSPLAEYITD